MTLDINLGVQGSYSYPKLPLDEALSKAVKDSKLLSGTSEIKDILGDPEEFNREYNSLIKAIEIKDISSNPLLSEMYGRYHDVNKEIGKQDFSEEEFKEYNSILQNIQSSVLSKASPEQLEEYGNLIEQKKAAQERISRAEERQKISASIDDYLEEKKANIDKQIESVKSPDFKTVQDLKGGEINISEYLKSYNQSIKDLNKEKQDIDDLMKLPLSEKFEASKKMFESDKKEYEEFQETMASINQNPSLWDMVVEGLGKSTPNLLTRDIPYYRALADFLHIPKYPTLKQQAAQASRDLSLAKQIAGSSGELIGDLPVMVLSSIIGKGAGRALADAPKMAANLKSAAEISGRVAAFAKMGSAFTAFAAPAAIKSTMTQYQKLFEENPNLRATDYSFMDYLNSANEVIEETGKAGVLGMTTILAEPLLKSIEGTSLGSKLMSMKPTKFTAELLAEGTAFESGKTALEGRYPTKEELASDAVLITGMKGVGSFVDKFAKFANQEKLTPDQTFAILKKLDRMTQRIMAQKAIEEPGFQNTLRKKIAGVVSGIFPDNDLVNAYEIINSLKEAGELSKEVEDVSSYLNKKMSNYYTPEELSTLKKINKYRAILEDPDVSLAKKVSIEKKLNKALDKFDASTSSEESIMRRQKMRMQEIDSEISRNNMISDLIRNKYVLQGKMIPGAKVRSEISKLETRIRKLSKIIDKAPHEGAMKERELLSDMVNFLKREQSPEAAAKYNNLLAQRVGLRSAIRDLIDTYNEAQELLYGTERADAQSIVLENIEAKKEKLKAVEDQLKKYEVTPVLDSTPIDQEVETYTKRLQEENQILEKKKASIEEWYRSLRDQKEFTPEIERLVNEVMRPEGAKDELSTDIVETDQEPENLYVEDKEVVETPPKMSEVERARKDGESPNLDKREADTRTLAQIVKDAFSIESRFRREGGLDTGFRAKIFASSIENNLNEGTQLGRKILKMLEKPRDRCLLTMFLESEWSEIEKEFKDSLTPEELDKFRESHKLVREYFDKGFLELKEAGALKNTFQQNHINKINLELDSLRERLREARGEYEKKAINKEMNALKQERRFYEQLQFVHIPAQIWLESAMRREPIAFRRKMNALTSKRRKSISIRDLVEEGIIDPTRIDILDIIQSYSFKKGMDLAAYRLLQAGMREGLVSKVPKEGYRRFEKGFSNIFKDYYVSPALYEFLEPIYNSRNAGDLNRFLGKTKMLQFFDPLRVGVFDLWQLAMRGIPELITNPVRTIKSMYAGVKDYLNQTPTFKLGIENGLGSSPIAMSINDFYESFGNIKKDIPQRVLDNLNPFELIKTMSAFAWKGDMLIRSMNFRMLLDQGYTPRNAAQIASSFNGDYASIPQKTRALSNIFGFTPTFKFIMGKLFGKMLASPFKLGADLVKGQELNKTDLAYFKGLVGTSIILGGMDMLLRKLGFQREIYGYRYYKRFQDEDGLDKEFVFSNSNPANLPVKIIGRAALAYNKLGEVDRLNAALKTLKWEIHTTWRIGNAIVNGEDENGRPLFNPEDPELLKYTKRAIYGLKKFMPISESLFGSPADEDKDKGAELLDRELGNILAVPAKIFGSSTYVRGPFELKMQRQINHILKEYQKAFKREAKEGRALTERQHQYFIDELEKAQKLQEEYVKEQMKRGTYKVARFR